MHTTQSTTLSNSTPRSIALVGLSGVGKSSVGRMLASRLGWPLHDTDASIVQTVGNTIAHIFANAGEEYFRNLETQALAEAFNTPPVVIATGGGIILRNENRKLLRDHAFVVWLDAPTSTLVARLLAHNEARPLLHGDDPSHRLETLRRVRADLYQEVAQLHFDVSAQTVDQIANAILQAMPVVDRPHSFV